VDFGPCGKVTAARAGGVSVELCREEKSLLQSKTTIGRKLALTGAIAIFPAIVPGIASPVGLSSAEKSLAAAAADSLAGFQVADG
jgi:hypothetical protein